VFYLWRKVEAIRIYLDNAIPEITDKSAGRPFSPVQVTFVPQLPLLSGEYVLQNIKRM